MASSVAGVLSEADALIEQGQWQQALDLLAESNREQPRASLQQGMLDLRLRAGRERPGRPPAAALAAPVQPPGLARGEIPEIPVTELSAQRLYDAIHGCGAAIVRQLVDTERSAQLRELVDRVVAAREQPDRAPPREDAAAWYARSAEVRGAPARFFASPGESVSASSSIWVADSPRVACELLDLYASLGLPDLLQAYFGEPARLSVKKWVLRKIAPDNVAEAGWHQDGRFLGEDIQTVNMWLALSDCGGAAPAPGLDIVVNGQREIYPTGTAGAVFDWTVGPELVATVAAECGVAQPRFAAGDALFFDHYNLHRTAFAPHHTAVRYAIESWFFAASTAPLKQQPILL
ncbi:hypothetical protein Q6D67_12410 [Haliea sp. E1-2-M8]|uniref:hypothetical protein n=1 Tax=Haliea sp. E1-2-M8 TaxID=3064706 RepID=UPI002718537F|nr:hypothetical protein [Haliea sp. E1-2-M8]MDO8862505.1 hypothetical protein [Haliea sp. E1-2-M8]